MCVCVCACACVRTCLCVHTCFGYLFGTFSSISTDLIRASGPHGDLKLGSNEAQIMLEVMVEVRFELDERNCG